MARCTFCGVQYEIGVPVGSLFVHYPDAEYRYWGHCLTETHQRVLRARHDIILHQLTALPDVLAEAKVAQLPASQALRRLLT